MIFKTCLILSITRVLSNHARTDYTHQTTYTVRTWYIIDVPLHANGLSGVMERRALSNLRSSTAERKKAVYHTRQGSSIILVIPRTLVEIVRTAVPTLK